MADVNASAYIVSNLSMTDTTSGNMYYIEMDKSTLRECKRPEYDTAIKYVNSQL